MKKLIIIFLFSSIYCFSKQQIDFSNLTGFIIEKKYSKALKYIDRYYSKSEDKSTLLYYKSQIYEKQGKEHESFEVLNFAMGQNPNKLILLALADKYFGYRSYSKALELYNNYNKIEPSNQYVNLQIGKIYYLKKDVKRSVNVLKKLLNKNPDQEMVLQYIAMNYISIQNYLGAMPLLKKVIEINPHNLKAVDLLCSIYLKTDGYSKALTISENSLDIDSTSLTLWKVKAISHFKLEQYVWAMESYKKLIELKDSSLVVKKNLAYSCFHSGDYQRADNWFKCIMKDDQKDPVLIYYFAKNCKELGEVEKSTGLFQFAIEQMSPDSKTLSMIYASIAENYMFRKEFEKSIENYQLAYQSDTTQYKYLFHTASCYRSMKQYQKAIEFYKQFTTTEEFKPKNNSKKKSKQTKLAMNLYRIAEQQIDYLKKEAFFNGEM
jgi:tetratricopeptide (TPR) repeat protein